MAWACGKWRGPLSWWWRTWTLGFYLQAGGGALRGTGNVAGVRGEGGAGNGAEDGTWKSEEVRKGIVQEKWNRSKCRKRKKGRDREWDRRWMEQNVSVTIYAASPATKLYAKSLALQSHDTVKEMLIKVWGEYESCLPYRDCHASSPRNRNTLSVPARAWRVINDVFLRAAWDELRV